MTGRVERMSRMTLDGRGKSSENLSGASKTPKYKVILYSVVHESFCPSLQCAFSFCQSLQDKASSTVND